MATSCYDGVVCRCVAGRRWQPAGFVPHTLGSCDVQNMFIISQWYWKTFHILQQQFVDILTAALYLLLVYIVQVL